MNVRACLCCLAACLLLSGCRSSEADAEAANASAEEFARYAELPALHASQDPRLSQELARLITEQATPKLLMSDRREPGGAREADVLAMLVEVVSEEEREGLLAQLDAVYPQGPFHWPLDALQPARDLLHAHGSEYRQLRLVLEQAAHPLYVDHRLGLLADTRLADYVRIYHRLEAIQLAESLHENRPDDAVASFQRMMRASRLLASAKRMVYRMEASQMREEAFRALRAVARHPVASSRIHQRLATILREECAVWTPDEAAWLGERAVGLHTYELVADGHLLSLLTWSEIQHWKRRKQLKDRVRAIVEGATDDQAVYLAAMRKIVEACRDPYFRRRPVLAEIESEFRRLEEAGRPAWIAESLLLNDFVAQHERQAVDRALCEAWSIALATAAGIEPPVFRASPLTGENYIVVQRDLEVEVSGAVPAYLDHSIQVPRRALPERSARRLD